MAKRGKKTRFSEVRNFIAKNFNPRQVKKLVRSVIRDAIGESETEQMTRVRGIVRRAGGGAGKVFGAPVRSRSWSPITKNLGAKILRMGSNVPPDLQAAAQDAVDGVGDYKNEKQLQEILRGGLGIEKSGATWAARQARRVRNGLRNLSNVGLMVDQAQRGGAAGSLAQIRLVDMGIEKLEDVTSSKFAQNVATGIAKALGHDPTKYAGALYAIGRGLRMGGAAGAIAQIGVSVAQSYVSQRGQSASAQMSAMNSARANTIDASLSRSIRRRTGSASEFTLYGAAMNFWGFTGANEEERAANQSKQHQMIAVARKVAGRLGIDPAAVRQAAAEARGIAVEDLTAEDINAAMDPLLMSAAKSRVSHGEIQAELIKKGVIPNPNLGTGIDIGGGNITFDMKRLQDLTDIFTPQSDIDRRNRYIEEEAKKIETEFATRKIQELAAEGEKQASDQRRRMSDVPPKMIRSSHQGQGGEVFMIPNPDYDRWLAGRRKTTEQVRTFTMERQSYARRKQVSYVD